MSFSDPKNLSRAILEVLVYFDLFAYPLTTLEVWKNLRVKASFQEVDQALVGNVWLKDRLEFNQGTWGLRGRTGERAERYRASKYKLDCAKRYVWWLRKVSAVFSVYACNTLGYLGSRPQSDIDLFIIARRGRIWTARFFAVLFAKLLFGRPHGTHRKDTICLSFFAAQGADLRKVALPGEDVYYQYWLKNLLLLFEQRQKKLSFGRLVEDILRRLQLRVLPAQLKVMMNRSTAVVVNDEFLKFHDHDRREYYRQQFRARFAAVST